jgi:hypothetical protein
MNGPNTDPYTTLGVTRTATRAQITAAYRALAQVEHPDRGGDTDRMAALNLAREVVSTRAPAADDPIAAMRHLVAGQSIQDIRRIRDDIRTHIRSFEQRGPDGVRGGALNDPRLARHRKELDYLNHLLS